MTEALAEYLRVHGFENVRVSTGRNGTNIAASCPFASKTHDKGSDTHPSWGILVETGVYGCFSCKKRGNLNTLASELGIPLFDIGKGVVLSLEESYARLYEELSGAEIKDKGLEILNLPDTFGFFDFHTDIRPLKWLRDEKRFTIDTLRFFGIGYNRRTKNPIFPITDENNNIVGWQERNLRYPHTEPKYLFSHNLDKRSILYNYHSVKTAKECVVVEAIMSVMALHEAGVPGISPLNADLSKMQAAKLGVFQKITLCYDNDIAGQVAKNKAIMMLKDGPFVVYSVTPEQKIHRMQRSNILPLLRSRVKLKKP